MRALSALNCARDCYTRSVRVRPPAGVCQCVSNRACACECVCLPWCAPKAPQICVRVYSGRPASWVRHVSLLFSSVCVRCQVCVRCYRLCPGLEDALAAAPWASATAHATAVCVATKFIKYQSFMFLVYFSTVYTLQAGRWQM